MPPRAKKEAMLDHLASEESLRRNFAQYQNWLQKLDKQYPGIQLEDLPDDGDGVVLEPIWNVETRSTT